MRNSAAVVLLLLSTACSASGSSADNAALCGALTSDLRGAGLAGTPSRSQASAAAARLDARVTQVARPELHDAVVRLHQHLHQIDVAWRKQRAGDATRAAGRARADAQQAARACGLAPDAFLS